MRVEVVFEREIWKGKDIPMRYFFPLIKIPAQLAMPGTVLKFKGKLGKYYSGNYVIRRAAIPIGVGFLKRLLYLLTPSGKRISYSVYPVIEVVKQS
jgi:hypothetical protein